MLRELETAVERKEECVSRWNIGILLRLFKFQNVKNSLDYSSVPVADIVTFPHYTDCRPDIPNAGIIGEKLALETHGEDLLAVVPEVIKLFPYQFTSSLPNISRYIISQNTIYGVNTVTQPLFKGYYAGCRVRVVNTTGVYVEDTCTLLKHWRTYGLMVQAPDDHNIRAELSWWSVHSTVFFFDCEDFAYVTFRGKRCTTVEALLLTGYLFYGQHVYQSTSVLLLLAARVLPRKVIRTFNILLIRWRIHPDEGTLTHALSCSWYGASAERFNISEATPVA